MRTGSARARTAMLGSLLILAAGCAGDRERPSATGPLTAAELSVWVVDPQTNDLVIQGREATVIVRAQEPRRQLAGIGFIARSFPEGDTVADSVVVFPATGDTTLAFHLQVPTVNRDNLQIDLVGVAYGTAGERLESQVASVIAVRCPENATWC